MHNSKHYIWHKDCAWAKMNLGCREIFSGLPALLEKRKTTVYIVMSQQHSISKNQTNKQTKNSS